MKSLQGMFLVFSGLVIVILSTMGMEASMNDLALIEAAGVSLIGGMIMGCGVQMLVQTDARH